MIQNILLIADCFPEEGGTGNEQRTYQFYRALSIHFAVHLLIIKEDKLYFRSAIENDNADLSNMDPKSSKLSKYFPPGIIAIFKDLRHYGKIHFYHPLSAQFLDSILTRHSYALILCRYFRNYLHVGLFRKKYSAYRIFVDLDDLPWAWIGSQKSLDSSATTRKTMNRMKQFLFIRYCMHFIRKNINIIVSNSRDMEDKALKNPYLIENIPRDIPGNYSPGTYQSKKILFVGNLKYAPNLQGLHHFATIIWKQILVASPDAKLEVIGPFDPGNPEIAEIKRQEGIQLLGYVDQLYTKYSVSQFTIAPIYWGGGTRIKIIEALSFSKTVVATEMSISGYNERLKDGESILLARSDQEFAKACVRLLSDPKLCEALGTKGASLVKKFYSHESFLDQINRSILLVNKA